MAKIDTLTTVTAGHMSNTQHNSNNAKVTSALQNTLSLDGSVPNAMNASMDLGSNRIINVADPETAQEAVTVSYGDTHYGGAASEAAAVAASVSAAAAALSASSINSVDNVAALRLESIAPNFYVTTRGALTVNDNGGGLWYASTGQAAGFYTDNLGTVVVPAGGDGSEAWLRVDMTTLNVKYFGAVGDGVADDTVALQNIITYVKDLAESNNSVFGLPAIILDTGSYKLTNTLYTKPWIKIQSNGNVKLDMSTVDVDGFVCDNNTTIPDAVQLGRAGATMPFLDGSRGIIGMVGVGHATSTQIAIKEGNFVAGYKHMALTSIKGISTTGFYTSLEIGTYDTYLMHTYNCVFGSDQYAVRIRGSFSNSGERMTFSDCVFAASYTAAIEVSTNTHLNFRNCSFDFNTDVMVLGATGTYGLVTFDGCHMEGWDNYIVDATARTGSIDDEFFTVNFSNCNILNTAWFGTESSSSTRVAFIGPIIVDLGNLARSSVSFAWREDGYFIDSTCRDITTSSVSHTLLQGTSCRSEGIILNANYDFQEDAVGVTALPEWSNYSNTTAGTHIMALDGSKKVYEVIGTAAGSAAYFTQTSYTPCLPGEQFIANVAMKLGAATGTINSVAGIEFYDKSKVLISVVNIPFDMRTLFNSSSPPNSALGTDRYMPSATTAKTAPRDAYFCKLRFGVTGFEGTVFVSRARLWKG